jgi:hypothetical protein
MTEMNPEMILWSRVLLQAIWDLAGIKLKVQKSEAPRLQRRTRAWFLSTKDSVGSFIWICNILSLDPDAVRERVLARPTAELRSLITSTPSAWDPASIVGLSSEGVEEPDSEVENEPIAPDADLVAESGPSEESPRHAPEEAPFRERFSQTAAPSVFHPSHGPGSDERPQSLFG